MGFGEKHSLSASKRAEWTVAVRAWARKTNRVLDADGMIFLGGERGRIPRDSVLWTSAGRTVRLADDWGKFKREVSRTIGVNPNADDWLHGLADVASVASKLAVVVPGVGPAIAAAGQAAELALDTAARGAEQRALDAYGTSGDRIGWAGHAKAAAEQLARSMAKGLAEDADGRTLAWWLSVDGWVDAFERYRVGSGEEAKTLIRAVCAELPEHAAVQAASVAVEAWKVRV